MDCSYIHYDSYESVRIDMNMYAAITFNLIILFCEVISQMLIVRIKCAKHFLSLVFFLRCHASIVHFLMIFMITLMEK